MNPLNTASSRWCLSKASPCLRGIVAVFSVSRKVVTSKEKAEAAVESAVEVKSEDESVSALSRVLVLCHVR